MTAGGPTVFFRPAGYLPYTGQISSWRAIGMAPIATPAGPQTPRNVRLHLRPIVGVSAKRRRSSNNSNSPGVGGSAKAIREPPLMARSLWDSMPLWILLHPERGRIKKCWKGCPLQRDKQDRRRYDRCQVRGCGITPKAGASVLGCRACKWAICLDCATRPRMPTLRDDPLLQGPEDPCLLMSEELLPAPVRERLPAGASPALVGASLPAEAAASHAGPSYGLDPVREAAGGGLAGALVGGRIPRGGHGTVIICPGGNYEFLSCVEGQPVVDFFASHGFGSAVLRYRLLPAFGLEEAIDDLEEAVRLVRLMRRGPVSDPRGLFLFFFQSLISYNAHHKS